MILKTQVKECFPHMKICERKKSKTKNKYIWVDRYLRDAWTLQQSNSMHGRTPITEIGSWSIVCSITSSLLMFGDHCCICELISSYMSRK